MHSEITASISVCATALAGLCAGLGTARLAHIHPVEPCTRGHRGRKRAKRMARAEAAPKLDVALRWVAGMLQTPGWPRAYVRLDRQLTLAGDPLGYGPAEQLAACALWGLGAGLLGTAWGAGAWIGVWAGAGALWPLWHLHQQMRVRQQDIARRLPEAIDQAAMCMGAGLDFRGTLALVAHTRRSGGEDHLGEELSRILEGLQLGQTRRRALELFRERVPAQAVHDFVGAVIQAEDKGTPLAEVMSLQAAMMRLGRSEHAEQLAARAGVLLTLPLVLLLGCILLVMFGPFLVNGMGI